MKEHYETVLPELSDTRIEELRVRANKLLIILNELEKAAPVFKKYQSITAVKKQLEQQAGLKEQKKKLDLLKDISLYTEFENSEWAKDYDKAYEHYQEKLMELPVIIAELENLTDVYESGAADSLLI